MGGSVLRVLGERILDTYSGTEVTRKVMKMGHV